MICGNFVTGTGQLCEFEEPFQVSELDKAMKNLAQVTEAINQVESCHQAHG